MKTMLTFIYLSNAISDKFDLTTLCKNNLSCYSSFFLNDFQFTAFSVFDRPFANLLFHFYFPVVIETKFAWNINYMENGCILVLSDGKSRIFKSIYISGKRGNRRKFLQGSCVLWDIFEWNFQLSFKI